MTEQTLLYPVWVGRLVFPFRYGKLAAGLLIFVVMWVLLILGGRRNEIGFFAELFFAAMCAYLIPIFSFIVERSVATFDKIEGTLDASKEECAQWRLGLTRRSMRWFVAVSLFALVMGVANIVMAHPQQGPGLVEDILSGHGKFMTYLGTLLIWLTMTTAIGALIGNAQLFSELGRRMHIDLLHCPAPLAVAQVAIMSTLSVIGAQVLFVFLIFDSGVGWLDILPGFLTTMLPVLILFLLPVWPLHKRLQHAKRAELALINQQLERVRLQRPAVLHDVEQLDTVNRLLLYRREILQVSEWPFDLLALTRLGLYLILPPLTWVAAALIENLVDKLL
jgi:hypothetical protein